MSYSSKPLRLLLGLVGWLALLVATGCMSDSPSETDMPWSAPAAWEGTMPIPGGYMNRDQ
jgi:hypothetical protein